QIADQSEAAAATEPPVSSSDFGVLPVANIDSPVLARYRRRSNGWQRLAVLAVVLLVVTGVAGAVYYAVRAVNSETDEPVVSKSNSTPIAMAPSPSPKERGKNAATPKENPESSDLTTDEPPFPRRALFICVSNYLYANPVSYGSRTRTVHKVLDRLGTALHIPAGQRFELSDAAKVGAHPTTRPVIERTLTDFLNSSRA